MWTLTLTEQVICVYSLSNIVILIIIILKSVVQRTMTASIGGHCVRGPITRVGDPLLQREGTC